jgi:predicted dehydrogenase
MKCCRRKARVVIVGDVSLHIERADLYAKELDVLISTSYGPGRYDPVYAEGGHDYPIADVRWTENRNMQAYLGLISQGAMRLEPLRAGVFDVDRAAQAYDALKSAERMIAILSYPERLDAANRRVALKVAPVDGKSRIAVALVGAGGFAQGMHLPNIAKLSDDFALRAVVSRTGSNAKAIATLYHAAYASTSLEETLADPDVQLVLIATRHDQHARATLAALRAGKHVFVEKPLALDEEELAAISAFYANGSDGKPLLMTGFNRRFAPAIQRVRELTQARSGPLMITYRMNAGFIPLNHWVHGPEGGGRNIGEACHIYDLFNALVGGEAVGVQAIGVEAKGGNWLANDNFVARLTYPDGSVATLTYTAMGNRDHPKEQMEVFCDGRVIRMNDFKEVEVVGAPGKSWSTRIVQKGQFEELQALAAALKKGGAWPISLGEQLNATRVSFEVERQIRAGSGRLRVES